MTIETGTPAPAFDLPASGGERVSLTALQGKTVVLYFYPKDDTTGCTAEAIDFTGLAPEFSKLGAVVVGVSKDTVKKHDKFKEKHGLDVILGSDEDGAVCEAYGVWIEKSMYGRKYMGIERATFLIDGSGVVRRAWRKVSVPGHAAEVLATVEALSAAPAQV